MAEAGGDVVFLEHRRQGVFPVSWFHPKSKPSFGHQSPTDIQTTETTFLPIPILRNSCLGEIAISPTYFVTVIISSVIWPNSIVLWAVFAISPKYFVVFLNNQNILSTVLYHPFFKTLFSFITKF